MTGSVQLMTCRPTTPATTVDARGLDTEATWNTVSGPISSGFPDLPHAKALGVHHFVLIHHGHGHPGQPGLLHGVPDQSVELGQGVGDFRPVQQRFDLSRRGREQ